MKICLSGSSGGHLNQLLQIYDFLSKDYEVFFVTNKTDMSEKMSQSYRVCFVKTFIIRDIFRRFKLWPVVKNIFQSLFIFFKEKPDIVITNGAGVPFGIWFWGTFFRKQTVFIETIARIQGPSTYGKYIGRFSKEILVQWKDLEPCYKGSIYSGIIFNISSSISVPLGAITKIFITVGTYHIQFNRLFESIDRLAEVPNFSYEIHAQIGSASYVPKHYSYYKFAQQGQIHSNIQDADLIICQSGSGSIFDALKLGKRIIAVPRLTQYGEFFDNHQRELGSALAKEGLILYSENTKDLGRLIDEAEHFKPKLELLQSKYIFNDFLKKVLSRA